MQDITIVGRLVDDAKIVESNTRKFAAFKVACNSKPHGQEKATFYEVTWSGYNGIISYFKKGSWVKVVGEANLGTEQGKDGRVYPRFEIFAYNATFPDRTGGVSGATATSTTVQETAKPQMSTGFTHTVTEQATTQATPVQSRPTMSVSSAPAPKAQPAVPVAQPAYATATTADDDLPF